jgi:predicted ester cyclase
MEAASAARRHSAITRRDLERAWNEGDLSVLDESLHPECLGHFPSSSEIRGPDAVKGLVGGFRSLFHDLHIEIDDLIATADKVVARWSATAWTAPGEKPVGFTGITIDRFADGRIIESWSEWDSAGLTAQLNPQP